MEEKKPQRSIIITLIILLVISLGWNFFQLNMHGKEITNYKSEVDSLIKVRVDLGSELMSTFNELNNYKGIAANLDSVVNEANVKIEKQQQKINQLMRNEKMNAELVEQLKQEIQTLKKLKEEYLEKIDNLMTENLALQRENMVLSHNVAALSVEKVNLEEKVSVGSKLKVEYVQIVAKKRKRNDKYEATSLAKKTNMLEACFSLLENSIAKHGEKTVYLRVISPEGLPLGNKLVGSSSFIDGTGEKIFFTTSKQVNYQGDKIDLCMKYEEDERILTPGTYLFEIYVDRKLSSVSSYLLR